MIIYFFIFHTRIEFAKVLIILILAIKKRNFLNLGCKFADYIIKNNHDYVKYRIGITLYSKDVLIDIRAYYQAHSNKPPQIISPVTNKSMMQNPMMSLAFNLAIANAGKAQNG